MCLTKVFTLYNISITNTRYGKTNQPKGRPRKSKSAYHISFIKHLIRLKKGFH